MKDYFISYNGKDREWAEWIAWALEEAGFSTVIQAWDFRPGGDFVLEMQRAATGTTQTIAVLSENYLRAEYTQPEWASAFARDPQGHDRTLLPVRIDACRPTGLLSTRIYVDLVGLGEHKARETLLESLKERSKPLTAPSFPGAEGSEEPSAGSTAPPSKQTFPGQASFALALWREKLEFLRQHEAITADVPQKFALRKQIEETEKRIQELSGTSTPGSDSAVAGKTAPGFGVVGAEVEPPIRPLLLDLENALAAGDLRNSEFAPLVLESLRIETVAKSLGSDSMIKGIRSADEWFPKIRRGAGMSGWQRDFAKTATPILVGAAWSLEPSPDAQAVVIRLCDVVARRLRLDIVWPSDAEEVNEIKNEIYAACMGAEELESDDVSKALERLNVTGPA